MEDVAAGLDEQPGQMVDADAGLDLQQDARHAAERRLEAADLRRVIERRQARQLARGHRQDAQASRPRRQRLGARRGEPADQGAVRGEDERARPHLETQDLPGHEVQLAGVRPFEWEAQAQPQRLT